jgi:hypothetical protein
LNHLDEKEPFHNTANVNVTVIPKPIATIAPDVSNAQVHTLAHNVYEKRNPTSNVFSAMATHPQTTKAVLFIKTYKREPSHQFEETKKSNIPKPSHTRTSLLPPPTLLLSNLLPLHPRLLTLLEQQNTHRQQPYPSHTDIQELKAMLKGLMEQMGTMLNLLTTLVSKLA